ncbi:MAG: YIP1 family protein [Clostridia bacterium]|nr:YIP1 family protein [Clostridia bacterium]
MKKLTIILSVVFSVLMIASCLVLPLSASSAYQTYTYSIDGYALYSPDAYTADKVVDSTYMGLDVPIDNPGDMICDDMGNVYIADTANNRIVVLDRYYKLKFTITTFRNGQGVMDSLSAPQGVFVSERYIWVCDTGANRIVVFDRKGNFNRVIEEPESPLFDDNSVYKPVAIAVDKYEKLYVVSSTTYQGIIVMTSSGEFTGFIGAQAVTISAWEIIWRRFQTEEQRENSESYVATEYNNIALNGDFIYVTTSTIDEGSVAGTITGKDKTGKYAPVKLLNQAGDEIMRRNGFYPPSGEIDIFGARSTDASKGVPTGVSTLIDVASGPEQTWSIIDEKRSKIYTYDFDGNLLFAFGDKEGNMLGNISSIEAICYQDDTMLILDKDKDTITVFERTEYGDVLLDAIAAENRQDYNEAINLWTDVLKRNSNFDAAYIGIGQAMYRRGDFEESLEYFEAAYDTDNWSNSYKDIRKEFMSKYFLFLVLGIVALIVVIVLVAKYIGKVNKRIKKADQRRSFWEELLYAFYVMLHPFDGFWDLKHERRGSLRGAVTINLIVILTFFYQSIGQGYLMNPYGSYSTIWAQAISVLVPLLLFVTANWCLTTLFEGEGSFKDIYIACSYSMMPIPLLVIPATIYSNFAIQTEVELIALVTTISFLWMGLLIFFGTQVTHDYSIVKNLVTILGTVLGMVFIMFIAILFTTLVGKLVSLGTNIVTELQYRM